MTGFSGKLVERDKKEGKGMSEGKKADGSRAVQ
jgi:hypothetical protein